MITKKEIISTLNYHLNISISDFGNAHDIEGIDDAADELIVLIKQKESEVDFPEPDKL